MASNNIFQQYLTPPKSVLEYQADFDQADARKQTMQQNALTLAAGQQAQADHARDREGENQLSRLLSAGQTPDQVAAGLAQAGYGKQAMAYTKQQQDLAKGKADVGHLDAQTGKLQGETEKIAYDQREAKRQKAISDIAAFTDPQQALSSLALHEQAGDITPEAAAQVRQTIPQNPADFPKWQVGMLQRIMSPEKAVAQIAPDANNVATNARIKEEGIANRGVQIRGQNMTDARAKESNNGADTGFTPEAITNAAARYNLDGTLPPMGMGKSGSAGRAAILNQAAIMKAGIDPEQQRRDQLNNKGDVAARNTSLRDFSSSGKSGQAIQATNTALNHLETIEQLALAQKNGNIRLWNTLANKIAAETGQAAPTNLRAAITMVAPEVSKAVIGAAGGQEERATFAKNFNPDGSPDQTLQGVGTIKELMGGRLTEAQRTYERTVGKKDFRDSMLSPAAQRVLDRAHKAGDTPAAGAAKPIAFDADAITAELKKRGH